eukprot:SM000272S10271  [mRNA]  locus=s272:41174:45385:+ [translate_table: standard]
MVATSALLPGEPPPDSHVPLACPRSLAPFRDAISSQDMALVIKEQDDHAQALQLLAWMKQQPSYEPSTYLYNFVMRSLCRARQLVAAEQLLKEMVEDDCEPDNVTYATLMTAASRAGQPRSAIDWFEHMQRTGLVPDQVTYTAAATAYGMAGMYKEALRLFEEMKRVGWKPDVILYSSAVHMYGKAGRPKAATSTFREMQAAGILPNTIAFNTMINIFGKQGMTHQANRVVNEMLAAGVKPNHVTFNILFHAFEKQGRSDEALALLEHMSKLKVRGDVVLYNSALRLLVKKGDLEKAFALYEQMLDKEVKPNDGTYRALAGLYAEAGRPADVGRALQSLAALGATPDGALYAVIVRGYARAYRFDSIEELVSSLSQDVGVNDYFVLQCLLWSLALCRTGEDCLHVLSCIKRLSADLHEYLTSSSEQGTSSTQLLAQILDLVSGGSVLPLVNSTLDALWHLGLRKRAKYLLSQGLESGIFAQLDDQGVNHLRLASLSTGAGRVALYNWLRSLRGQRDLPKSLEISTGRGKPVQGGAVGPLRAAVAAELCNLGAPFTEADSPGMFTAPASAVSKWLQEEETADKLVLRNDYSWLHKIEQAQDGAGSNAPPTIDSNVGDRSKMEASEASEQPEGMEELEEEASASLLEADEQGPMLASMHAVVGVREGGAAHIGPGLGALVLGDDGKYRKQCGCGKVWDSSRRKCAEKDGGCGAKLPTLAELKQRSRVVTKTP